MKDPLTRSALEEWAFELMDREVSADSGLATVCAVLCQTLSITDPTSPASEAVAAALIWAWQDGAAHARAATR